MGLLDDFEEEEINEEEQLSIKGNPDEEKTLNKILDYYKHWLINPVVNSSNKYGLFGNALDLMKNTSISNRLIKKYIQHLKKFTEIDSMHRSGLFISAMVQKAYNDGYNGFEIDMTEDDFAIWYNCAHLEGKEDDPIKIEMKGDIGPESLSNVTFVDAVINGYATMEVGAYSKDSSFEFNDRAGMYCCKRTKNCAIIFNADIEGKVAQYTRRCHIYAKDTNVLDQILDHDQIDCITYIIKSDGDTDIYETKDGIDNRWKRILR